MDIEEEILPEPFSEKNIDGSPIAGTAKGGSLFRTVSSQHTGAAPGDRRQGDRRQGERRQGDRRGSYDASLAGVQNVYTIESENRMSTPKNTAPDPVMRPEDTRAYSPAAEHRTVIQAETRFEPPVDEKPGMIPNPMKMPPVKVKSSLDYDYDYGSDIGEDAGYDYDYDTDAGAVSRRIQQVHDDDIPNAASIPDPGYGTAGSADDGYGSGDYEDSAYGPDGAADEYGSYDTEGSSRSDDADGYGSYDTGGSSCSDDADEYGAYDPSDDDYGTDVDTDSDDDYR